jgi:hypothetical protein
MVYDNLVPTRFLAPTDCSKFQHWLGSYSVLAPTDCSKFQHGAGILEQSLRARTRVGIGLSYRPTWAHTCKRLTFLVILLTPYILTTTPLTSPLVKSNAWNSYWEFATLNRGAISIYWISYSNFFLITLCDICHPFWFLLFSQADIDTSTFYIQ